MNRLANEVLRQEMSETINAIPSDRTTLQMKYEKVWNEDELLREFRVVTYSNPLVIVERISDKVFGSLLFQNRPRYYFSFEKA